MLNPTLRRRTLSRRANRRGVVLTTCMIMVLPVVVVTGLCIAQLALIRSARNLVQAAASAACRFEARNGFGTLMNTTHSTAQLTLGFLGANCKVQRLYVDDWHQVNNLPGSDGLITAGDHVVIGVTIPMAMTSTNYLGLLGVSTADLQLRAVAGPLEITAP